ncbi:hypothetical protein NPX13_g4248 [Xylaria arbuscula]|uniref:C2H2-type domain-containing protein n=1 Tax=Xylaria arbuscula TaxID=114810 RepID=A0A9W8NGW6_9PEZI|nr:hypothetical protein NPX13_g4248 [Xylaria arbuscula]
MVAGLDELIESLLTEIAFSGVRGYSIDNLLAAIDSFYKASGKGVSQDVAAYEKPLQDASKNNLAIASRVWRWLANRSDVSIGTDGKFNHLSLEQVLPLPEEEEPQLLGTAAQPPASTSIRKKAKPPQKPNPREPSNEFPTVRPRLHVSEERQWRTIAGHGPDLKRVPLFEWRALVDIASVKEKGILQGDLVRLTGQDKRSLPTRTDALARKGYIIKQPVVLRGGKSSKLWLAQFSEHAREHQEQEGLDYEKIDLSKAALTIDLKPVPFCGKWNGETIDYLALAQGFVAIAKAWGLIRYCDARAKLGVEERVRQMRALAKTCRWLTNIGALSFVGAKFAGSNRLFKDCVKWMRDPSPAEWSHFRATPKTRMVVPSGRIGKRGEASRAVHASQKGGSRGSKAILKKTQMTKPRTEALSYTKIVPSPWKPQKPVPNTAFEVVKRAGSKGTSNAAICRQTLGHNFRRLTAAMTGSISMPTNNQPPHLKHLSSASQLSRIGKTMTYTFYAVSEMPEAKPDEQHMAPSEVDPALSLPITTENATVSEKIPVFSKIDSNRFCENPSSSLTDITQTQKPVPNFERRWKRKRPLHERIDDQPPVKLPKRVGRPPKKREIRKATSKLVERHSQHEIDDTSVVTQQQSIEDQHVQSETPLPATRAPGVYRGLPNSLDPVIKRPGRRRKSLVIIFRSDKLKDPDYLGCQPLISDVNDANEANDVIHAAGAEVSLRAEPADSQDVDMAETSTSSITGPKSVAEDRPAQPKTPKSGKRGSFRCEKCGNSWKNSNGLEYHLNKSKTTCNPDFVPPSTSPVLLNSRPRKLNHAEVLDNTSKLPMRPEERRQLRHTPTPGERIESKSTQKERRSSSAIPNSSSLTSALDDVDTSTSRARKSSHPQPSRRSIVLKDRDVYNTVDNGRLSCQQQAHTDRNVSSSNDTAVVDAQASDTHDNSSLSVTLYADSLVNQTTVQRRPEKRDTVEHSPNATKKHTKPGATPQNLSTRDPPSIRHVKRLASNLSSSTSSERTVTRKPLPSISHSKAGESSISAPTPTTKLLEAQISDTTAKTSDFPSSSSISLANAGLAQSQSTHKTFESFARPMRPNASFGARRRERTIQIIEYLFDRNDGVFPGLRSLFMAVISVWVKEFKDLAPPDRRVCQNIVNQMERDNEIKQMHFFFFDDKAKMQECVVLVKADAMSGPTSDLTDDPRVIAVKDKMREMFPEAYVPDPFTLSPDEAKLFDQLASQGKDQGRSRMTLAKDLTKVQDIETLSYEDSVMDGISLRTNSTKRQAEEDEAQTPSKKTRLSVHQSDLPETARKPRRRPEKHEMWDSGKLAVYIWSQRQKPSAVWDQSHPDLQDPTTGTWSWAPENEPSQGNITTILSSVKSARHIDASLKPKSRKKYKKRAPRNSIKPQTGDDAGGEVSSSMGRMNSADGRDRSYNVISQDGLLSDEDAESFYEDNSDLSDNENSHSSTSFAQFATTPNRGESNMRQRPGLSGSWETQDTNTSADARLTPNIPGPSTNNMPRSLQEILSTVRRVHSFKKWADPTYGEFLRDVKAIRSWEQSANEPHGPTYGQDAQGRPYISLTLDSSKANMKPIDPEWLASNQFTAENIPNEIKDSPQNDAGYGLTHGNVGKGTSEGNKRSAHKAAATNYGRRPGDFSGKHAEQLPRVIAQPSTIPTPLLEYKTRDLTSIPKQPRGRVNKPAAQDDKLGSKREDELVAACIVFRSLLGGLDRNLDIGLLLKHFPGMSLSALKKFWPRVSRERKSYVQALTAKFHSGFIKAYESGELPSLDYDNLENYDWTQLILWTTQLETHEEVDLPQSRQTLYQNNIVEDVTSEAADWRDTWFATTSTYNRIEAVASETMSIPLPSKSDQDTVIIERARTWVRSICCTPLRGVDAKERLVPRLLELGEGDAAETNRILEKVVKQLNKERVITRTKGKDIGGNFRIHGMFSKQLEKMASTLKARQAFTFKAQLDEAFRRCNEYIMPYASDDGLIMAVLNLQAHGRIRVEALDMPNIPFGFEPGNYEGRTFPKSYYHFKARLSPTDTYLYNEDMALLGQAQNMEPPTQGPDGKIPIWVDFFGHANLARWADYVSMIVFTLALKGPIAPKMCVTVLKPMIEEFEVRLIVGWLDRLGLIQQVMDDCGVTAGEWWWLVAGCIAQLSEK